MGYVTIDIKITPLTEVDIWTTVAQHYTVGQMVTGVVTKIAPFGAFVLVENRIEDLIHLSEVTPGMDPKVVLVEGKQLHLRILRIDPERRRLGLNLQQTEEVETKEKESTRQQLSADANKEALSSVNTTLMSPAGTNLTLLTTKSGLYKVNASIRGVTSAFKGARDASEKISINLQEWKDLNNALVDLKARGPKEETQVREFGKNLFQQVITGNVYDLYKLGKNYCSDKRHILRLRFHLGSPELIELPWEFLWERGIFLALTKENPRILITRCMIDVKPVRTVEHHLPLQIMIMTAEPNGHHADAKREKDLIKEALNSVESQGFVLLREMRGTDIELETIHINRTLDILHFIGHGGFNEETQEGELILEGTDGTVRRISAFKFFASLPSNVRLVFLNACESARENSVAYFLAQQGHVVIAMQFKISIKAAVRFAKIFYAEIAKGKPIDEAVLRYYI